MRMPTPCPLATCRHIAARSLSTMFLALLSITVAPAIATTCESLSSLEVPNTTISTAQSITGGTFVPPGGAPISGLPHSVALH